MMIFANMVPLSRINSVAHESHESTRMKSKTEKDTLKSGRHLPRASSPYSFRDSRLFASFAGARLHCYGSVRSAPVCDDSRILNSHRRQPRQQRGKPSWISLLPPRPPVEWIGLGFGCRRRKIPGWFAVRGISACAPCPPHPGIVGTDNCKAARARINAS